MEEHDALFQVLEQFDCIIGRINPGQNPAAGGDQAKCDEDEIKLFAKIPVWPMPDMHFGLRDTIGYGEPSDLEGFKKTISFQPRVVKQNRGSAGEGIWIVELAGGC